MEGLLARVLELFANKAAGQGCAAYSYLLLGPSAPSPCSKPCSCMPWAQAIGAPISRLSLYTAYGGLQPAQCLPVTIDVGTNNEALLQVGGCARHACWAR